MSLLPLDISNLTVPYGATARLKPLSTTADKTRTQAKDFESMFLSSMMQHMFTAIGKEGPLGSGQGTGPWRSMLTDQFAKSIVKSGGIGIADQIYKSLMARKSAAQAAQASQQIAHTA